jgi:2-C-methyl-D-erythritol 2,4-cyclodiphosphate synthase
VISVDTSLEETVLLIANEELRVLSADITIIAERPKLVDFMATMSIELSSVVGALVTVKATTVEGLGALGRVEGLGATAVVLLEEIR